ncbi:beta-hexosaminidase [Stenotrophomonas acidaminiphila]|nr:beta-hexosaminidase [Stenotrophomonas acidaminiphila]
MRRSAWLSLCLLALCQPARAGGDAIVPSLIPQPASMRVDAGAAAFAVDASTVVQAEGDAAMRVAGQLNGFLAKAGRTPLPIAARGQGARGIRLAVDPASGIPAEGYALSVGDDGITIRASSEAGLFHGAMTLWQLLTQSDAARVLLPAMRIEDAPRFPWRGYMLDSARHFQTPAQVRQLLDTMALHKLNVFHWHLTDDQGWRIEIKRHPRLTQVGGCRIPAGDAGIDPASGKPAPYCGWYSQDEIRDIVAHAAALHISVVPEIDMPGHATAAIAAYPALGTEGRQIPVSAHRGIHANLFNVDDATFDFLDGVFAEVAQLFPGRYIHVGGDEAIKTQWRASPRVQARMRTLGLADEDALQSWFIHRLEALVHAHGKRLIGWDEILDGGLAPDATVMSWRGIEGGLAAARQGHDVVMSPNADLYLDYLQTDSPDEPGGRPRPKLIPMERFYRFEPVPEALDADRRQHILGLQANMWTTDDVRFAAVEHNTFPRLLAVAETGWTPKAGKDYASFLQRLPAWTRRYAALGVGYARTPFRVLLADAPAGHDRATLQLSNPLGYPVRYTLDGSEPTLRSPLYTGPIEAALPVQLRGAAFAGGAALQPADRFEVTAASLRSRGNAQLQPCSAEGPVLRMQDDTVQADGRRALFNVAFMQPCWRWEQAPMTGAQRIEVRAGRLPYIIDQSEEENARRRYLPARSAHGELDIRAGSCDGDLIATAPLPAHPDADGFVTLRAPLLRRADRTEALCIRFSGDFRPDMWVVDRVTLR